MRYQHRQICFFLGLLLVASAAWSGTAKPLHLHLTTGFTQPVSGFYRRVIEELDRRMPRLRFSFEEMSAERSLELANRGINDGECCRFPEVIVGKYPNLLPLQESFFAARFVAFSKDANLPLHKFDDLKPYSVGTVQGWRLAVREIKRVDPRDNYVLSTPLQLMEMLKKDRIQVAVVGLLSGLHALHEIGLEGVHAYKEEPLASVPLVMMLNRQHADLRESIDQTLRKMKQDGTIQRMYDEMIDRY